MEERVGSEPRRRYLFFARLAYAFPILRPIEDEVRRRGDEAAWLVEEEISNLLREEERRLLTVEDALRYDPMAVFAVENYMLDFLPGIKVQVFHGFSIRKRKDQGNGYDYEHFKVNGLFDLYCTHGETSTGEFERLSAEKGFFKVSETGWPKLDYLFRNDPYDFEILRPSERPCILYTSTFTKGITSTPFLYDEIERLAATQAWDWLITFHPKMEKSVVLKYKALSEKYPHVIFYEGDNNLPLLKRADVMVCDSSSIIVEFLMLDKPVVTFRNTNPGDYLIDIERAEQLEESIERALKPTPELLGSIRQHTDRINPYRDGRSAERVLEAVERFRMYHQGLLKSKPWNLIRKIKMRLKAKYYRW